MPKTVICTFDSYILSKFDQHSTENPQLKTVSGINQSVSMWIVCLSNKGKCALLNLKQTTTKNKNFCKETR